jgi:CubicO group peptidase (beta-lactamase class C family)
MALHATPQPAWLLAYPRRDRLVFKPGSRYAYSNSDNIVVGLMIQAATGRSFEQDLARLVFRPRTAADEPARRLSHADALRARLWSALSWSGGCQRFGQRRVGMGVRRHRVHAI